jgi:hypothetical protein
MKRQETGTAGVRDHKPKAFAVNLSSDLHSRALFVRVETQG